MKLWMGREAKKMAGPDIIFQGTFQGYSAVEVV